jgi:hypothetical protein
MRAGRARKSAALFVLVASTVGSSARAQETRARSGPPTPRDAVEITAGSGYAHSFGTYPSSRANDSSGGIGADLTLGLRVPSWAFGVGFGYSETDADRGTKLRTFHGGVASTYHLAPQARFDPWIRGATGYRFVDDGATHAHGFQIAQIAVGTDLRVSQLASVGPIASVELDAFPGASVAPDGAIAPLQGFVLLGLQGRFDILTTGPVE